MISKESFRFNMRVFKFKPRRAFYVNSFIISYFILSALVFTVHGCSSRKDETEDKAKYLSFFLFFKAEQAAEAAKPVSSYDNIQTYFSTMNSLDVQVVYEPGAEPLAGSVTLPSSSVKTLWTLLEDNLKEVFKNRSQTVTVSVPKELSGMQQISSQGKTSWTSTEIQALAAAYRTSKSTSSSGKFFIAFLNGYFSENGTVNQSVIGVNITGTPFIAVFKQVVNSTGDSSTVLGRATRAYVEQSTLIHEMGHALGLVNNGVSMTSSHQDTANGKHCTNTSCVMYYANTGTSALAAYVQSIFLSGTNVMFKTECLQDTQNYKP
ncbi:MAG TPA: hypothetical protein PL048_14215 [Leptospiraceae bacterium]|nr:hypothetical protein [Leptospiraceae bacterium]HMY68547.1 hypothetical protein [Leptospiraceae bacterium]HMZ59930.1 hypothetical protein [Leptospiraceae bacterium]HNF13063.1 hypothetical protein [Leptospiraceae bacterium]HNF25523.1 hypothetical protein [Leptospiraceae bacterium]